MTKTSTEERLMKIDARIEKATAAGRTKMTETLKARKAKLEEI